MSRLRFTIRTLLVVVAICAIPLAWVGYSLRWIQERRAYRTLHDDQEFLFFVSYGWPAAPRGLWLFGEGGACGFIAKDMSKEEIAEGQRLFPEAKFQKIPK